MPKPNENPEQLSGQDKVELAAEPTSESVRGMIKECFAEAADKIKAEMYDESRRVAQEAAAKVLEGKGEEAAECDPTNIYGKDHVEAFQKMIAAAAPAPKAEAELSPLNKMAHGAYFLLKADGNAHIAAKLMQEAKLDKSVSNLACKALGVDNFTTGGALVQDTMANEVVPELLTETALFGDGAIQRVPVSGQYTVPYENSGPTTRYVEENAVANASEPAFEQLTVTPKQRTIIVPVSKTMLRSVAQAASMIEQSMRRSMAVDTDLKYIRGAGVSSEPMGLRYLANSSNILTVDSVVSVANRHIDLVRLQEAVQNSNVGWSIDRSRYAFSPRTWRDLVTAQANFGLVFAQEMLTQGSLLGAPIAGQSGRGISAIPENLSVTDSSETEIYFYSTDWLVLAVSEDMRLEMGDGVAYNNSSGTVVAGFSRDQVAFKLTMADNMGSRVRGHDIAVLSDVDWGV